jgi:tetratricopeptide (TPR) repeat protein
MTRAAKMILKGTLPALIAGWVVISFTAAARAQTGYETLMKNGDYAGASKQIETQLSELYSTRVDGKRIPNDFVVFGAERLRLNVNRLFRERKAESFFIENNPELYKLHTAMGKCLIETKVYDDALNHLYQALRFRAVTYDGEDDVFYLISQANKKSGSEQGYLDALETAYSINERKFDYSLELGKALSHTRDRKRAVYHLERYANAKGSALEDAGIYLTLAGLSEDIGRYLDTEKYYLLYLEKKPDDGFIHFALGHAAFKNTGNYTLAEKELRDAIRILPESEIYRKGKAFEYIGDMKFNTLKWNQAVETYQESIRYQTEAYASIKKCDDDIAKIDLEINNLKTELLKEKNYVKFNEYQFKEQEKQRIQTDRKEKKYEYEKLEPGRIRWNMAECMERLEKLQESIDYYRQTITFSYKPNEAREKIVKLQLKIKRGY